MKGFLFIANASFGKLREGWEEVVPLFSGTEAKQSLLQPDPIQAIAHAQKTEEYVFMLTGVT